MTDTIQQQWTWCDHMEYWPIYVLVELEGECPICRHEAWSLWQDTGGES